MRRRVFVLIAAALLAVFSGAAVLAYANRADQRALGGREGKWVLLAVGTIPADTTIAQIKSKNLVRQVLMPAETVPSGAVSKLDPSMNNLTLNAALQPDQMLLRGQFEVPTTPSPTPTFQIPRGKIAVSVALNVAPQVAGNVNPGDQVTVFDVIGVSDKTVPGGIRKYTKALIPRATVISVGESATETASPTPTARATTKAGLVPDAQTTLGTSLQRYVVTLAVDQDQAQVLITGASWNSLYLGMLGAGATVTPAPEVSESP